MILAAILILFVISQLMISALEYDGTQKHNSGNLWHRAVFWLYQYINNDDKGGQSFRLKKVSVLADKEVKHQH